MSYETNDKMVSHPDHYRSGRYEVIDIIDEFTKDLRGTEAVCTANAIKYILRWKKKNGIQDVKKAIWYLTHLVEHLENKTPVVTLEDRELDLKNDETLYSMHQEGDKVTSLNKTTYSKKFVDEALKNWKPKLEPGCDKCEISECKFLEDPFMNPPYNELLDKWKTQKENIYILLREKKELEQTVLSQREEINQLMSILLTKDNNIGFVNDPIKANKQLAEDFNNKADNKETV